MARLVSGRVRQNATGSFFTSAMRHSSGRTRTSGRSRAVMASNSSSFIGRKSQFRSSIAL